MGPINKLLCNVIQYLLHLYWIKFCSSEGSREALNQNWVIILAEESPVQCSRVCSPLLGCPFMNMYPYTRWKNTRPADEKDVPLYNCLSAKVLCKYPALLLAPLFGMEAFHFPLCHWVCTRLIQWQKRTVCEVTFVFLHVATLRNSIKNLLKGRIVKYMLQWDKN